MDTQKERAGVDEGLWMKLGQATVIALCVAGLSHGGMFDQSGDLSAETSEMPSGRFLKVSRRRGWMKKS